MLYPPAPMSTPSLSLSAANWRWTHVADRAALGVLLLVAVVALFTFRDYGLGWDDYTHAQYGDLLLSLYGSGFRDQRALSFVNLYMYGGGFDMIAGLVAKILPFDLFETRRLVGAAVGLIGLATTWRLTRRLGGPVAGFLALVLLAACPIFYGHMFMNPKDGPFAVEMIVLLYGLVRAFEEYPEPSRRTVVIFGVGLGIAFGGRILAGLSALYAAAALALLLIGDLRDAGAATAMRRLGRFVLVLLPGLALAYLLMGLAWPWSVLDPLNPIRALTYFSEFFEKPWKEMFAGALVPVPDMPWTYLPTMLFMKLPEILIALALVGLGATLFAVADSRLPRQRRAALLLVVLAPTLPIAVALVTRPAMYNGIRHFTFLLPAFAVLGGIGGAWLLEAVSRYGTAASALVAAVLAAGIAVPVVAIARLHPYEYTYFNDASGGIAYADDRYMLDYWGLSFKQAAEALLEKLKERQESPPPGRRWKVAVCGPHPPAEIALGPQFEATWDSKGADFAMMLGEFYCANLDAPVLADVEREGITYARVFDIRGRRIPGILTLPPP
jgi:hypothetical protein